MTWLTTALRAKITERAMFKGKSFLLYNPGCQQYISPRHPQDSGFYSSLQQGHGNSTTCLLQAAVLWPWVSESLKQACYTLVVTEQGAGNLMALVPPPISSQATELVGGERRGGEGGGVQPPTPVTSSLATPQLSSLSRPCPSDWLYIWLSVNWQ